LEKTKKGGKQVNNEMNKYLKISVMLCILIVVASAAYVWATLNTPIPRPQPPQPIRFPFGQVIINNESYSTILAEMQLYYTLQTVLATINATLLVFLMVIYIDIYKTLKSEFTIGLIIFSMILLLYALVSNPLLQNIFGFRGIGLGPFAMLPHLFTCLALAVLIYLTMK
jgi:hypothetical protein